MQLFIACLLNDTESCPVLSLTHLYSLNKKVTYILILDILRMFKEYSGSTQL